MRSYAKMMDCVKIRIEAPQKNAHGKLQKQISYMARGAGFEPARPLLTTGLAGLPPTRLGQPR